jgi:hypothetical protein
MPQLIFQGNIAITMQGPGDGVLQPTLAASGLTDTNSLDAGSWPQDGALTWAPGPGATDKSFFPAAQYCQFFPSGFSTFNFTDSHSGVSVQSASAIVFLGHVYLFSVDHATDNLTFLEYVLPAGPTNGISTLANIPFSHPFGVLLSTSFNIDGLFIAAWGVETAAVAYFQIDGVGATFLYLYPELVALHPADGIANSNAILPINSPDFQSGINYTVTNDAPNFLLSQWRINGRTIEVLSAPTAVTYDAPLTARGVIEMKPCAFGWLLHVGTLGTSGKNTVYCLASRDFTKYWSLILTPSTLSTGFGFSDDNFGLQLDESGHFYQFTNSAHFFSTANPQTLPLTPSLPDPVGPIPDGGVPAGDGTDPQMILQVSNDGGKTWSNERSTSMGKIGNFRRLMKWRRLGQSNNRCYRVICSEPVQVGLVACDMDSSYG